MTKIPLDGKNSVRYSDYMTTTWCSQPVEALEAGDVIRFTDAGRERIKKIYQADKFMPANLRLGYVRLHFSNGIHTFPNGTDVEVKF